MRVRTTSPGRGLLLALHHFRFVWLVRCCRSSRLRRALCRTCLPGDNNEFVAEIVQYPDTFSFRKQTAACHVLHEAKPGSANTKEIEEDTCVGSWRPLSVVVTVVI